MQSMRVRTPPHLEEDEPQRGVVAAGYLVLFGLWSLLLTLLTVERLLF